MAYNQEPDESQDKYKKGKNLASGFVYIMHFNAWVWLTAENNASLVAYVLCLGNCDIYASVKSFAFFINLSRGPFSFKSFVKFLYLASPLQNLFSSSPMLHRNKLERFSDTFLQAKPGADMYAAPLGWAPARG